MSFAERGSFEICEICWWEDDNIGFTDPDVAWGPNDVSLNKARENYRQIGAMSDDALKHVRRPLPDEIPNKEKE